MAYPVPHLQEIMDEIKVRIETVPDTDHKGFWAGNFPSRQCTAIGKPVQERIDGEAHADSFRAEIPIYLHAPDVAAGRTHHQALVKLYAEVKLAIHGGDLTDIDTSLGGKAMLVEEVGLETESSFDLGQMEADAVLTIAVEYATPVGDPYEKA